MPLPVFPVCRDRGYTLLEAVMSVVIIAMMALSVTAVFTTGLRLQREQSDSILAASALRSKMEFLESVPFGQLASGTETVTINAAAKTITWTVSTTDLDANGLPDEDIKRILLELDGITLTTFSLNRLATGKL